jgi:hypothetical protein
LLTSEGKKIRASVAILFVHPQAKNIRAFVAMLFVHSWQHYPW